MSMISSLIDELRKSADEWNGSNMFELARMCSEAADTILQLRDDLQRANAENAKLRELVQDYHTFLALTELAQPIGYIVAAHGHPTLSIAALDERYRELGVEVDG